MLPPPAGPDDFFPKHPIVARTQIAATPSQARAPFMEISLSEWAWFLETGAGASVAPRTVALNWRIRGHSGYLPRVLERNATRAALVLAGVVAVAFPALDRIAAHRAAERRLDALGATLGPTPDLDPAFLARARRLGPLLSSWETIGGCGAGASTGSGGSLKWVGRNVSGGLFHVELQGDYVHTTYGYNYIATALVSRDLNPKWNVGVNVPYLYKLMRNPYDQGDVANEGPGDVNLLVTRHLGVINDWTATLSVGLPTGTHSARVANIYLPQDRQLGLGEPTATVIVDHTIDKSWGPTVVGGTVGWRGSRNDLGSSRAPAASVYGYSGYLLGPLVPALGVIVSGAAGHDEDQGVPQGTPLFGVAANASLEWSTDWLAVLVGGSLPYGYTNSVGGSPALWSLGPWVLGLGLAFAPF
jgi:hypothetical protein